MPQTTPSPSPAPSAAPTPTAGAGARVSALGAPTTGTPAWQVEVLLDDDDLWIVLHRREPAADTVVVTFDPILWPLRLPAFAGDFLRGTGVDTIAVRKKREHFYQPLTQERFDELLAPHLPRYRRRIAYGSSLGAYAVLYYCQHGFDQVVASSPRVSAHPRFGAPYWQDQVRFEHRAFDPAQPASSPAVLFYDPKEVTDRRLATEEVAPAWPGLQLVAMPYAGHPANQYLSEIGYIAPFMRALATGRDPPPLLRSRKRQSAMYCQELARALLRRGRLGSARTLAERAVALNPKLLLAERTLGEVALAQGRFDEAEPLLQRFAEHHPLDPGSQALLVKLRQQRDAVPRSADETPAKAIASAEQPSTPSTPSATMSSTPSGRPVPPGPPATPSRPSRSSTQGFGLRLLRLLPWMGGISRDDVLWCYRELLGREPESDEVVDRHLAALSHRRLVRNFVGSQEFAHRVRKAPQRVAAPEITVADLPNACDRAVAASGPRPGATAVVVGNCQAPGLAAALRAVTDLGEVRVATVGATEEALQVQLKHQAADAELWLVLAGQTTARAAFDASARPGARWMNVPALQFNAFHPDVCYAQHRATQVLTKEHYNSAIVVWAYANGLDEDETARLFRTEVYRALGYFDVWQGAVDHLRKLFAASDLKEQFAPFMLHMQRQGCFMHTPNHPQLAALVHLAGLAAAQVGLKLARTPEPGELADGLNGTIWPVYPEIARELGLAQGSTTWKLLWRGEYLDGVPAYVARSFQAYREQGIARDELVMAFRDGQAMDAALRRLTGR